MPAVSSAFANVDYMDIVRAWNDERDFSMLDIAEQFGITKGQVAGILYRLRTQTNTKVNWRGRGRPGWRNKRSDPATKAPPTADDAVTGTVVVALSPVRATAVARRKREPFTFAPPPRARPVTAAPGLKVEPKAPVPVAVVAKKPVDPTPDDDAYAIDHSLDEEIGRHTGDELATPVDLPAWKPPKPVEIGNARTNKPRLFPRRAECCQWPTEHPGERPRWTMCEAEIEEGCTVYCLAHSTKAFTKKQVREAA